MSESLHIITELRDAAKQKRERAILAIEKAKLALSHADIEIAAYETALSAMDAKAESTSNDDKRQRNSNAVARQPVANRHHSVGSFTEKWIAVFRDLFSNASEPYSYDDVLEAAQRQGSTSSSGSLRAQMMKAVNGGFFDRVDVGKFKITDAGLELIGRKENGPPKGGPEAEEVQPTSKLSAQEDSGNLRSLFP